MANNALIQGAALTGKKFLDVAGAVKQGLIDSGSYNRQTPNRVDENKAVQAKVNNYMRNMKTDMDFTSFSPEETATMRSFLLNQRSIYAEAAKKAAAFDDTTDPDYMLYVDQMQNVNNSFTNLAAQLKAYKKSKIEYASAMQEGLYSDGNQPSKTKEAATIYGFLDEDGDGKSDKRYNAPFKIQPGGNIAFDIDGQEISYSNMEEPFLKDTKFLNGLNKTAETAYNSGLSGKNNNPYSQDSYNQQLNDALQNENTLRSIIYDFNAEAPMSDIGNNLDNGVIDLSQARELVKERLLKTREDAYMAGKKEYDKKQQKLGSEGFNLSASQIASNNENTEILNAWAGDETITGPKKFNYIVRSPKSRATTTQRAYEISKTADGRYFLISNGRPEALSPELAKEMFNIDLK